MVSKNLINLNDGAIEYIPNSVATVQSGVALWKIAADADSLSNIYSNYLAEGFSGEVNVMTGVDVGNNSGLNITYSTDASDKVVMRTNGGTLTVDASNATVEHYGIASVVNVKAVAGNSYHEFGKVVELNATSGRIVIESTGLVNKISEATGDATFEKKEGGLVLEVSDGIESTAVNGIVATEDDKANYVLEISTASELADFRDSVNNGMTYAGLTVKLTADIDLSAYTNWLPIGYERGQKKSFNGNFDGQGHTISNLSINTGDDIYKFCNNEDVALFGKISYATIKNFTVAGTAVGNSVAGVVASCFENSVVDSVTSNVLLIQPDSSANARTGGICDMAGGGATIKNYINNGRVSSANGPTGGIVGYAGDGALSIFNCKNTATIENTIHEDKSYAGQAGGILGASTSVEKAVITIKDCVNDGEIKGAVSGGIVATFTHFNSTIESCINNADVTAYSGNCGGIVGDGINITLKDCVVNSAKVSGKACTGGLIGCLNGINKIDNCTVNEQIDVNCTGSKKTGKYVGLLGNGNGASNSDQSIALTVVGVDGIEGLFGENRIANKIDYHK